jgi:hypothetical protein
MRRVSSRKGKPTGSFIGDMRNSTRIWKEHLGEVRKKAEAANLSLI